MPSIPFDRLLSIALHIEGKAVQGSVKINQQIATAALSKQQLLQKIKKLQTNVNDLNTQIAELTNVQKENKELRDLLRFGEKNSYTTIFADIISKSNITNERSVVINKGSKDGVKIGNPVIIGKGTLLGKVVYATANSSRIRLTTDTESSVLATISESEHTIAGSLEGSLSAGLILNLIPKNIPILPNQLIITNGFEAGVPPNLFLGKVVELKESENEVFNSAIIEPPYIFEDITVVGIVIEEG